jgi:hypothetical protein
MNNRYFFIIFLSVCMFCGVAQGYDSSRVASAAGRYYGMAVSVDYFFVMTRCQNTKFGMRKVTQDAKDFVFNDINRSLRDADRADFASARDPAFIKIVESGGGVALVNYFNASLRKTNSKTAACADSESYAMGMLTHAITDFYSAIRAK